MVNAVTFTNGNSYNDGTQAPGNLRNGGHRTNLVLMLEDAVTEVALAVTAASEAKTAGGFSYTWEADVDTSDPGTGKIKGNNASLASITALYISETTNVAQAIASIIASWDDGSSTVKGYLRLVKQDDLQTFAIYTLTGSVTDGGAWDTLTVGYVGSAGTFADGDAITVQFIAKGDKGETGATGATGADGSGFTRAPVTATGSANAYVLTPVTPVGAYADQQVFVFEANFANTGAATLNISGLGAKAIRKNFDEVLVANDIKSGQLIQVSYEAGTDRFQMMNNPGNIFTTERESGTIVGSLYVQDYVIGYFDYDATLSYASLVAGAGTGTVSLYLSSDRTSASGTVITGASAVAVSTTLAGAALTAGNTVASGSPKYLVAKCTATTALTNVVVNLKVIKNMDD